MNSDKWPSTLVVLPRFPNPHTGTGQRSQLVLEAAMAAGDAHVVLVDGGDGKPTVESFPGIVSIASVFSEKMTPQGMISKRLGGGLRLLMPRSSYAVDSDLHNKLREIIADHDISTVIYRYMPTFCAAGLTADMGLQILVDVDDRDDQKYESRLERMFGSRLLQSFILQSVLSRLSRVLNDKLRSATHVWFAVQEDVWPVEPAGVSVLPNVPFSEPDRVQVRAGETAPVVLFVGVCNHLPNRDGVVWFLEEIWDDIRRKVPDARLRLVGRGGWDELSNEYGHKEGVEFVGEVDDLAAEYKAARLAISPIREGGGTKIKVLEAAAFGRPVVAHSHSLRGFEELAEGGLVGADSPADFARQCIALLDSPERADSLGERLRVLQNRHFSRAAFIKKVKDVIAQT